MTTATPDQVIAPAETTIEVRACRDGGSVRVRVRSRGEGPRLRAVITGSDRRTAAVSLVPDGALLLAGDRVGLVCDVGPGVDLLLTEPGGTVAYPMDGRPARWTADLRVADAGGLRWHGQPFVVAAGAEVERDLRVELTGSARLLLRETTVLGRYDEQPGRVRSTCSVTHDGQELLREDLDLGSHASGPGMLGKHRVLDQVVAVAVHGLPPHPARMDLASGGSLFRALCTEAHDSPLDSLWATATEGWDQSDTDE